MPDVEHCLAMADEAERLAAIVSYGRDKARLKQQAESWREKARAAERVAPIEEAAAETRRGWNVVKWLSARRVLAGVQA